MKKTVHWAVAVRGSQSAARARARAAAAALAVCGLVLAGAGSASAAQATTKRTPACSAPVVDGATATVTCSYTGAAQYWTVPAGVTQATFTLYGAAGGTISQSGPGGSGAEVTGTLPVTPGTILQVNVGQAGGGSAAAFGGGGSGGGFPGGGGASDIRDGAYTLADRLLVAGGGGGGGGNGSGVCSGEAGACTAAGGAGGNAGSPGGAGTSAPGVCDETLLGAGGGGAGTATMGGAGGAGNTSGAGCEGNTTPPNGAAGSEGSGGASGESESGGSGGGGGGGYYGGGGGGAGTWDSDGDDASGAGGGGGGSSFTGTATGASVNDDPASLPPGGNGEVIITYAEVLTSHHLTGHETAVSCLSASLCVAVGSRHDHGVVVTLTNGAQSHAVVLRGSSILDSVSCVNSGCWAIGLREHGSAAFLVKISSAGRPSAERIVSVPAAVSLGPISCSSMTSCEVAGAANRIRPAAIEIGTWTGAKLRLHRIVVTGTRQVSMGGISCWHGDCEAVGFGRVGPWAKYNLILRTSGGRPGPLFDADNGYYITHVSCISATTCYASGGAKLYTITNGVPSAPQVLPGAEDSLAMTGIECTGTVCEVAGWQWLYSDGNPVAKVGVLVSFSDGMAGTPSLEVDTGPFTGIAGRASSGFIAIGAGSTTGSEDTSG